MRKVLLASLVLAFTLALAAFSSSSNLDKANGDWTCDAKATMALHPELKEQMAGATEMAEAMFSNFALNINAKDKKMSVSMGQMSESGAFKVISDSGKSLVLQMDGENDKLHIDFTTDDAITVYSEADQNSKVAFTRKK